jgi:hypothetical protein
VVDRLVIAQHAIDGPHVYASPALAVNALICRMSFVFASRRSGSFSGRMAAVSKDMDRSLARIDVADLLRLAALAADAEAGLFGRHPYGSGRYAGRLLGRALCQGAAVHYVNGKNGVKDFDVWSFYAQHDDWPFPARWRGTQDFGPSKFGRYPGDPPQYTGRRVDLLGRSLPAAPGADPVHAIHDYLAAGRTPSARALAAKAVVLIDPMGLVGEIVWPTNGRVC